MSICEDGVILDTSQTLEVEDRTDDYAGETNPVLRPYRSRMPVAATWRLFGHRQLMAIMALPAGWDGDGAKKPDVATVESAMHLLRLIAFADPTLPKPSIDPTRSGGVQFTWEHGQRYLVVEVRAPYRATLYFADDADGTEVHRVVEGGTPAADIAKLARTAMIEG